MDTQDAPTAFLVNLWPWIEANKNRLIALAGIIVAVIFIYSFFSWQKGQQEQAAGMALTQLMLSTPPNANAGQVADAFLKIATDHPSTLAGQRAQLQAASALFNGNRFADAQAQFQKYLDSHPDGAFAGAATLGVAASLEAQGKLDMAAGTYQRVGSYADFAASVSAKFGLARIDELQGKLNDAMQTYVEIMRTVPGSAPASDAQLRLVELRAKMATVKPAAVKS